jgi:hypothetical protein
MATVLLCAASSGSAETAPPGQFHRYGSGTTSCGTWLADRDNYAVHMVELSWVLGWLSAAGAYNVQSDLRHTDANAIAAWVDKYCRENPLDHISDAAAHLVDELSKPK